MRRSSRKASGTGPNSPPLAREVRCRPALLGYLTTQGRIPATSTLGQICFGVEVVSTGGSPARFAFTDFSITDAQ